MRDSASFQIIPRPVGRLGLWLGPHVVGWLGTRVWVSAIFQIFVLTAGEMSSVGRELSGRGNVREICSKGEGPTLTPEMSGDQKYPPGEVKTCYCSCVLFHRLALALDHIGECT